VNTNEEGASSLGLSCPLPGDLCAFLLMLLENAPSENKNTVYMVIGLKSCRDGRFSSAISNSSAANAEASADVNSAVTASTGAVLPVDISITAGAGGQKAGQRKPRLTALGDRIFAVQYRPIKRNKDLLRTLLPRRPQYLQLHNTYIPKTKAMYSADENDEDLHGSTNKYLR
jgi:hypothetical protein